MNSKLIHVATFVVGAAVGSIVTWKLVKTKYEQRAQAEIDSVKEAFAAQDREIRHDLVDGLEKVNNDLKENLAKTEAAAKKPSEKPSLAEYAKILNETGYSGEKGGSIMTPVVPYVIPPDEYGDEADYSMVELRYFADKVLTDSWYNVIDDDETETLIGLDALDKFGMYEPDSVHVRNDNLKTDYEILADIRKYHEIDWSDPDTVGR